MKTREQAYELIYAAIDKSARQGASNEGSIEKAEEYLKKRRIIP